MNARRSGRPPLGPVGEAVESLASGPQINGSWRTTDRPASTDGSGLCPTRCKFGHHGTLRKLGNCQNQHQSFVSLMGSS